MKYVLLLLLLASSLLSAIDSPALFTGEIADSSCAYNVHSLSRSHKEMLKSKTWGDTPADCVRRCVKQFGGSYVLVHKNDVFRLEQQDLAEPFAGADVKISGTLSADGKTIHIEKIAAAK
jgi:hypothetical protein